MKNYLMKNIGYCTESPQIIPYIVPPNWLPLQMFQPY
jgi:hypothetical protein